ncbi:ArnT family glycosyltransferase [Salibacter halophilus]|uniref:Glycosyltransferase RgtA/B/C/D-like domain-containing protein n=1 Tax=Salibacter halophilus TaxID=1803916 RepID=A0A6N6M825_9FLAO|nr:glycosyltransferase family 39 protein [Salibacter halophilus]KAB1066054.1 hypothetical protein F3059_00880 [Salibacter halophilus]
MKSDFVNSSLWKAIKKNAHLILTLGVIILIFSTHNLENEFHRLPQGPHAWRQADCLSFANRFYYDNNSIFEPAVMNLGESGTGKVASEFPILNYTAAQIWKITGVEEGYYRIMNFSIFLLGLFFLADLVKKLTSNFLAGPAMGLLLACSPIIIYYGFNFLADVPALGLQLISLWAGWHYFKFRKPKHLIIFLIVGLLGGLIKASGMMAFLAVLGAFFFSNLSTARWNVKNWLKPIWLYIGVLTVIAIQASWYIYADAYSRADPVHEGGFFLVGLLPIWEMDAEWINRNIDTAITLWGKHYYNIWVLYVTAFLLLMNFIFIKRVPLFWRYVQSFVLLGVIAFFVLFFQPLGHHDYYLLNCYIIFPVTWITSFLVLKSFGIYEKPVVWTGAIALTIFAFGNVKYAKDQHNDRYMYWRNAKYRDLFSRLEGLEPILREKGIKRTDEIIIPNDMSIQISLYYLNQLGYQGFQIKKDPENMRYWIEKGAQYAVAMSEEEVKSDYFVPFTKDTVLVKNNVYIVELIDKKEL